jgi:hypothetical protein
MSRLLDALPRELGARLPDWRERWIQIGTCTAPADRDMAERAIARMYRSVRLATPRIVWCDSPLSQALTRAVVLSLRARAGTPLRNAILLPGWPMDWDGVTVVRTTIGESVWSEVSALNASVSRAIGPIQEELRHALDRFREHIGEGTIRSVRDSVWDSVWDRAWTEDWERTCHQRSDRVCRGIHEHLWVDVVDSIWASVKESLYGQHDAGSLAGLSFLREVCGLRRALEHGAAGELLARSAGWVLPHRNICWVSERHSALRRDERGLLHCLNGPAISYPDGWQLYYWHGRAVPREWIEQRDRLDPSSAFRVENLEHRRVLVEIIGWARILEHVPTRVIDRDRDPMIGTLLECDVPGLERSRFLKVRCGTGRIFVLCVPRDMRTALQANAWTYGCDATDYRLEART